MTETTEVSSAGNEEIKVDEAGSSSSAEKTAGQNNGDKDYKKLYHEMAGKFYKLKDEIKTKTVDSDIDTSSFDDAQLEAVNKIAEKKARELLENRERNDLVIKEEEAFLRANPQAYEKLEDIRSMKNRNPEMSLNKIYKFFFDEEPETVKPQGIKGVAPKTVVDGNDLSREAVNESFNKMRN